MKFELFVDMDGVLTHFEEAVHSLPNGRELMKHLDWEHADPAWEVIHSFGHYFWSEMPWLPGGKELWENIRLHNPKLLTTPTPDPSSREGKQIWVNRELCGYPGIMNITFCPSVIFSFDKKEHAAPNRILIDDRLSNIEGWRQQGGIGIHHTSFLDSLNELHNAIDLLSSIPETP